MIDFNVESCLPRQSRATSVGELLSHVTIRAYNNIKSTIFGVRVYTVFVYKACNFSSMEEN